MGDPGLACFAQSNNAGRPVEPSTDFAFEVVSIRPSKLPGMSVGLQGDLYSARGTSVWGLMFNAYHLPPNADLPGLPGWAKSDKFDVEAKMDEETFAAFQKMPAQQQGARLDQLLQGLLASRFGLRIHHELKEQPVYELVIAKSGPKLKEWPAGDPPRGVSWGKGRLDCKGMPMESFVYSLSDTLSRTVVDKTGLTGKYEIALRWAPDELQGTSDAGPSIFTAIQEQLGLKLAPARAPVDVIVVDHVERPSEN